MGVTGKKKRKGRVVHKHMNRPKVFLFLSPPRKQKKNRMAAFFFQSFCMLRLIDLKCRFKDEQMSNGPELGNPFRFGNFWGFSRAHTHKNFVPKKKEDDPSSINRPMAQKSHHRRGLVQILLVCFSCSATRFFFVSFLFPKRNEENKRIIIKWKRRKPE